MTRLRRIVAVLLLTLISVAPAWAEAPPYIQAVEDFLLGWGKENWDAVKAQTGGKVTVKLGGTDYALDAEAKKGDAKLVLPFRGLSSVREKGKVTGVTVDQVTVKAGDQEKQGKATVALDEKDGRFTVTGLSVE